MGFIMQDSDVSAMNEVLWPSIIPQWLIQIRLSEFFSPGLFIAFNKDAGCRI